MQGAVCAPEKRNEAVAAGVTLIQSLGDRRGVGTTVARYMLGIHCRSVT